MVNVTEVAIIWGYNFFLIYWIRIDFLKMNCESSELSKMMLHLSVSCLFKSLQELASCIIYPNWDLNPKLLACRFLSRQKSWPKVSLDSGFEQL